MNPLVIYVISWSSSPVLVITAVIPSVNGFLSIYSLVWCWCRKLYPTVKDACNFHCFDRHQWPTGISLTAYMNFLSHYRHNSCDSMIVQVDLNPFTVLMCMQERILPHSQRCMIFSLYRQVPMTKGYITNCLYEFPLQ